PDDLPTVACDQTRIHQVILNLLSNAARFVEVGGITVQVAQQEQNVLVSVADTGPGISPEDHEQIFEPFSQGSTGVRQSTGGSGLGLSISKQFVKLHGGQMWVESQLGIGTTFHFTLPVVTPVDHLMKPGHQIKEGWIWQERAFEAARNRHTDDSAKPRVIVWDEYSTLTKELTRTTADVEFVEITSSSQVTDEVQQCPARAIIVNSPTPEKAWSSVREASYAAPCTPIIGCCVPQIAARALAAGALGHLVKPVTRTDIESAIRAVGSSVRRVLVVDDDPDVLSLLTRFLWLCDGAIEVTTAQSGEQALAEINNTAPDLVLLDIRLPGMDGWQVLESMRGNPDHGIIPTFFISADDPAQEPLTSKYIIATMDERVPLQKLLTGTLQMSDLLLSPDAGLHPAPG
ncbi:MAG: ATP-binding protein, partial [Anaerolineae bacterium]|nr:ATP-binding protein [Anaerolineae bacterium]